MGSIEVYDVKQQKWVLYIPDYDKWYQHFKDLSDEHVQPNRMGRYVVGSGRKNRKLKEMEAKERQIEIEMREQQTPIVKLVSPVTQSVEMAKSEIEREQTEKNGVERGQYQRKKYKSSVDWDSFKYIIDTVLKR